MIQFQVLGACIRVQLLQSETHQPTTKAMCDDDDFWRSNFVVYCLQQIHQMLCRMRYLKEVARVAKDRFVAGPIERENVRINI